MKFAVAVLIVIVIVARIRRANTPPCTQLGRQLPQLIDAIVLLIHAGYTPAMALTSAHRWVDSPLRELAGEVGDGMSRGRRFAECVSELRQKIGAPAVSFVDILIAADRDGQSISNALDRLSSESRAMRLRQLEADIRRLPVQLTIPLVCCILPSFFMLGVVPMVASTLIELNHH